jgi:hypothetical protein
LTHFNNFNSFSSQGKSPEKNWKFSSRKNVKKTYAPDLKGFCFIVESKRNGFKIKFMFLEGKLSLPYDDKIHGKIST